MQPGGEDTDPMTQPGTRKGVGNFGFDDFLAARTVTALNPVFNNFAVDALRDVFDDTRATAGRAFTRRNVTAAVRTGMQCMFFDAVNTWWTRPVVASMPRLSATLAI